MTSNAIDGTPTGNPSVDKAEFANEQQSGDPFAGDLSKVAGSEDMKLDSPTSPKKDRSMSREWDASKVPPSQFQKRKGSIYSTPSSRDSHVKGATRDQAYHDKIKEKGWGAGK